MLKQIITISKTLKSNNSYLGFPNTIVIFIHNKSNHANGGNTCTSMFVFFYL